MKPRILIEVIGGRDLKNLNKIRERIDFRRRRLIRFPAKTFLRLAVIGAVAIFLFLVTRRRRLKTAPKPLKASATKEGLWNYNWPNWKKKSPTTK